MSEHHLEQHEHEHHEHPHFLDQWGTAVVILYGLLFLTALVTFAPKG